MSLFSFLFGKKSKNKPTPLNLTASGYNKLVRPNQGAGASICPETGHAERGCPSDRHWYGTGWANADRVADYDSLRRYEEPDSTPSFDPTPLIVAAALYESSASSDSFRGGGGDFGGGGSSGSWDSPSSSSCDTSYDSGSSSSCDSGSSYSGGD
jgi:hypothetical protein